MAKKEKLEPITNKEKLLDRKAVQARLKKVLKELREFYGGEEHLLDAEVEKLRAQEPGVLGDLKALMWARGELEVYQAFRD